MKIAAFNVKRLGLAKVNKPVVQKYLIKIVSRYSVVVMLEVMDKDGKAMNKFLKELNRTNRYNQYAMVCSEPLGRGHYKEKFVYFYREDEVTVTDTWQYKEDEDDEEEEDYDDDEEDEEDEEQKDVFSREPFILRIKCPNTDVQNLVLIPVHTKPEEVEFELKGLHDVVEAVRQSWRTDNIMLLGDFNADGPYLSQRRRQSSRIFSSPYHWLVDEDADTTTSNCNDHTYDRIVVYGNKMLAAVVPNSAQPFNFQKAYHLSDDNAKSISDHYPVEVELRDY